MRLCRLIADFNLIEARLRQSLSRDVSVGTRVSLTRRAASLFDIIERHDPENPEDLRTKIEFFLRRAQRARSRHDLTIALDLIARFDKANPGSGPCVSRSTMPNEVLDRLVSRAVGAADIISHIRPLVQRASLLDREFRHLCTSRGNLEFHAAPAQKFDGLHMAELIGTRRYRDRAQIHMQGTMSGLPRAYYYALDVPTLGTRVMQCAMRPWAVPNGEVSGLLMWVNDVTDRLSKMHGSGDVPFALPDHSIEGTT